MNFDRYFPSARFRGRAVLHRNNIAIFENDCAHTLH
jgi:hypothetical protein